MNIQELKNRLISGYTGYLANQKYPVFVCIDDNVSDDAAYIYLTVFKLARDKFTISLKEKDNAVTLGKAKTIRRHKIATNIPGDTPMFEILDISTLESDDLDVNPERMEFSLDIDTDEEIFTVF
jgi:hypothetical protein